MEVDKYWCKVLTYGECGQRTLENGIVLMDLEFGSISLCRAHG